MKKITLLFSLLLTVSLMSYSQIYVDNKGNVYVYDNRKKETTTQQSATTTNSNTSSEGGFDRSKLSLGGIFGLQLGSNTFINVSPQVGYDFSKYMTLGVGLGYMYFKDNFNNSTSSFASFNLFGHFYPIEQIIIAIQPEVSHMWRSTDFNGRKYSERGFLPSLIVGGGIRYNGVIAMIQYDVIQNIDSPYGNSIFYTVGYSFNF